MEEISTKEKIKRKTSLKNSDKMDQQIGNKNIKEICYEVNLNPNEYLHEQNLNESNNEDTLHVTMLDEIFKKSNKKPLKIRINPYKKIGDANCKSTQVFLLNN